MTPDIIFMWVPIITFGIFAARYARLRAGQAALWYVGLCVIVFTWHQFDWPLAVPLSIGLWLLYGFVVPHFYMRYFTAMIRRDFERARYYERWAHRFMPMPAMRGHQAMSQAYDLMEKGEVEAGLAIMDTVAESNAKDADFARTYAAMIRSQYQVVVDIAGSEIGERNTSIRMLGIRALAELGRLDDAVEAYALDEKKFRALTSGIEQALTKAGLYIHAGDVATMEKLLNGPLRAFPQAERDLMMARAEYYATGDWAVYAARLNQLMDSAGGAMSYRIKAWLDRGPRPAPPLREENRARLAAANQEQEDNRQYFSHRVKKPRAAQAFIIINLAIFLFTVSLASDSLGIIRLDSMIAMHSIFIYPALAVYGEWWRLLTATFLHYNYLHVGFNMLALIWFGYTVERRVGHGRFIIIYLLSGIGSMLAAIASYELTEQTEPMLALGASGSIFGVLGAVLALALLAYRRTKLFQARQDINAILIIVLIQTAFDWAYLDGSSPLHISGLISGFLITLMIAPRSAVETAPGTSPEKGQAPVNQSGEPPPDNP